MFGKLRRNRRIIGVAAVFGLIVLGVHTGAPYVFNHLTYIEAENLSFRWLKVMATTFDLPGKAPTLNEDRSDLISRLIVPEKGLAKGEGTIDLFRPDRFGTGRYLTTIRGYAVFTNFGDRFISGGTPVQRDLRRPGIGNYFDRVMQTGRIVSFINTAARQDHDRVVSVMVPLFREGKAHAVAVIDVTRSPFEYSLFFGIQRVATATAAAISFVAFLMLVLMSSVESRRKRAETEADFLARHDALTGLPNRRQFNSIFPEWLQMASESGERVALFCIDIDNFKNINDEFGHFVGDRILIRISERLKRAIGADGFVSRLSGDEFAILLRCSACRQSVEQVSNALLDMRKVIMKIDNQEITTSVSIGVAIYPEHGRDVEDLIRNADLALYQAKAEGRAKCCYFTEELNNKACRKRRIRRDLHVALRENQFRMMYQPQVDTATGTLTGFEALIRWRHPVDGDIPPSVFIPIAEQCGLIKEIGFWTLTTACREAAKWPEEYAIAVNMSPPMFNDPNFVDKVKWALDESGLAPARLEVEITESLLLGNSRRVVRTLNNLRALGVGLAMDDFGTGYSSLSYLTRIPVTKIKIDQSFVQRLGVDENIDLIVRAIIGIGSSLNVTVMAEGVESTDQLRRLREMGCSSVQGYLYGRPVEDPFARPNPLWGMLRLIDEQCA